MATIKLKHPFIHNDEQITEITLPERLKLKHMRAMDEATGEIGKIAALIASLAELPRGAVDLIDVEDFAAISEATNGFLDQSRATGGT